MPVLLRLLDAIDRIRLRLRLGSACGPGLRLFGCPIITLTADSTLRLGGGVTLISRCRDNAIGVSHPVVLRTLRPQANLEIGNGTGISGATIVAARAVTIGRDCLIGADAIIADNDLHPVAADGRRHDRDPAHIGCAAVRVGDNVFIGARAIILKGVSIGDHAVIGAGSVVTHDVPARAIAAGNPARVVGMIPDG